MRFQLLAVERAANCSRRIMPLFLRKGVAIPRCFSGMNLETHGCHEHGCKNALDRFLTKTSTSSQNITKTSSLAFLIKAGSIWQGFSRRQAKRGNQVLYHACFLMSGLAFPTNCRTEVLRKGRRPRLPGILQNLCSICFSH